MLVPFSLHAKTASKKKTLQEKFLSSERTVSLKKSDNKTSIDFGEENISATHKIPGITLIEQARSNNEYSFVKIRMQWHSEMNASANSLENK